MTAPAQPIRLYQFAGSGHCHRARVFLSLLGLPFEVINLDRSKNEQKTPEFMAKNGFGQVPVIEDGEVTIADSNAILVYLALRYDPTGHWLPREPAGASGVQRWLSVAAGEQAAGPLAARRIVRFNTGEDLNLAKAASEKLFALLETQLASRDFLTGAHPTIGDIALYSYTALAPQSGLSLDAYPHLRGWLSRIEGLPGFVQIQ